MDDPKSFPERLGALIDEGGATHAQVARWMDVHRVSVTQWLSGRSEPRGGTEAVAKLAAFFGCSPAWLSFGYGKRPSASTVRSAVHEAIARLGPEASDVSPPTADDLDVARAPTLPPPSAPEAA